MIGANIQDWFIFKGSVGHCSLTRTVIGEKRETWSFLQQVLYVHVTSFDTGSKCVLSYVLGIITV